MEPMVIVPPSLLNVVSLASTSSDGTGFIGTKLHVTSTGMLTMSSKSGTAISMVMLNDGSEGARVGEVVGGTYGKLDFDTLGVKDVGAGDGAGVGALVTGPSVGGTVGARVGVLVAGASVVGRLVVGAPVGTAVGTRVGLRVGLGMGALVTGPSDGDDAKQFGFCIR